MLSLQAKQLIENTVWEKLFSYLKEENLLYSDTLNDSLFLRKKIYEIFESEEIILPERITVSIIQKVLDRITGLGPLEDLLNDKDISEIMVNGKDAIFIEKKGKIQKTELFFSSEDELLNIINRIVNTVGRRIDESSPMVDARLEDGSRVNAIISPLSLIGPVLTIRKFSKDPFTLDKLQEVGSITEEMKEYLYKAVTGKENIVISGGTGTGKTSMLNALSRCIDDGERLITIEDSAELQLQHPNLISLESRPANIEGKGEVTIRHLVKNALRMRPDRIIVGEIRSSESLDMLQAMNTGHEGSITTVHANSPLDALYRLETMVLMGELDLPLKAIRQQVIGGVSLVIQLERTAEGVRRVSHISKVGKSLESRLQGEYEMTDIFHFDKESQTYIKKI